MKKARAIVASQILPFKEFDREFLDVFAIDISEKREFVKSAVKL
jgi:hypothetical protein